MRWLAAAAGGLFVVSLLSVALSRIAYPFELEWMEGGSLDHAARVKEGKPLYVEPSYEFVPFIYTPVYYYFSAGLSSLLGLGFLPLRLLSLLSSLGCSWLIYRFIRLEGGDRLSAWIGFSSYAATYRLSGFWFDIGRVDALFLFFLLSAAYVLRRGSSFTSSLLAAALMAIAFLTKQTALVVALPLTVFACFRDLKKGLVFLLALVGLLIGSTVWFHATSQGWYSYYVFQLPRQHAILDSAWLGFWTRDMLKSIPVGTVLGIGMTVGWLYSLLPHRRQLVSEQREEENTAAGFYSLLAVGLVTSSWLSRLHSGGFINVVMPAYAACSLFVGLAVAFSRRPGSGPLIRHAAIGLALINFVTLIYDPRPEIPTTEDRLAGEEVVRLLREAKGPVLIPYHGHLARLAGKEPHAHQMAAEDIERGSNRLIARSMTQKYVAALREKRFAMIVLDEPPWISQALESHYQLVGPVPGDLSRFIPVTGSGHRPLRYYVPKP